MNTYPTSSGGHLDLNIGLGGFVDIAYVCWATGHGFKSGPRILPLTHAGLRRKGHEDIKNWVLGRET